MADFALIIIIIALTILLGVVSFYTLAIYVHSEDKKFGRALYCKILVCLGMLLCWSQALLLPLDVTNSLQSMGIQMNVLWQVLYISILLMVVLIMPFAIFFYETDDEKPICSRICVSTIQTIVGLIVAIILLFVTWVFLNEVALPVNYVSTDFNKSSSDSNDTAVVVTTSISTSSNFLIIKPSLVIYSLTLMSFVGWILLIFFGGIGMFALPLDLIKQFIDRPKLRTKEEMKQTRQALVSQIKMLAQECTKLRKQQEQLTKNDEDSWFKRFRNKRTMTKVVNKFKSRFNFAQQRYEIFQLQLKYMEANPLIPFFKLLLGIVFLITAIFWQLQIIIQYLKNRNISVSVSFINDALNSLEMNNVSLISTALYAYLVLYLVWAIQKGNIKFGLQLPLVFKFHLMKQNETWMNSFLFNMILILLGSCGIIQLSASTFPTYTRDTEAYTIFGLQARYMKFYQYLYDTGIFEICLMSLSMLSLLYLLFSFCKKPKFERQVQEIKQKNRESW